MDKERGFFMHRDFYIRLINREHPPAIRNDCWNVRPPEPPPSFFTPATDVA